MATALGGRVATDVFCVIDYVFVFVLIVGLILFVETDLNFALSFARLT